MASLPELMLDHPQVAEVVKDPKISHMGAVRRIRGMGHETSDAAVRRARRALNYHRDPASIHTPPHAGVTEAVAPEPGTGKCEETPEGGEFSVTLDTPIMGNNFDHVFRLFNLDPDLYEIVEDTVRSSTWQQSKRLDNGDRDTIQLYSYSCRFRRLGDAPLSEEEFDARRERVLQWTPLARRTPGSGLGEPSTLVVNWADWQLGKSEGGGWKATEQRVLDSFQKTYDRFHELRKIGRNVEGIALVNMGDPTEGCVGNYASQTFTVELTQRRQILLAMDLYEQGILTFGSLVDSCDVIGVLCNHGEWTRQDGKAITSDSDNVSGFLLDSVQRVLKHREDMSHLRWHIPQDEMITMVELSGVHNAFSHGHKIPSGTQKAEEGWLANQSIHLLRTYGTEPRIWTTAHKHHANVIDMGPWWRIQCSALDGGSKWYLDSAGKWSTPGTTTYLIGNHDVRGFSDYSVL